MKKILFIIDSLRPGGAERQLVELIKGLDKEMFEIHLCCLSKQSTSYEEMIIDAGIKVNYFEKSHAYDVISPSISIMRYILSYKIEIVHTFLNFSSLVGCFAARVTGRYAVCSAIRGAMDANYKYKISTRLLSRISDVFISNSKAGFNNRFKKYRPNFKVIYNGIDFNRFDKCDNLDILRTDLGIRKNCNVLGMIGSLLNYKDHVTLINAMSLVLEKRPETQLLIIGDGPERETLKNLCKSLKIKNNVIFTGFRNDVECIYKILDVTIMLTDASIKQEGTSNAILESMAVGVPVVASEGGGTGEIIDDSVSGFIVPVKSVSETANKILLILNSPEISRSIADTGKKRVRKQFSLEKFINSHAQIYLDS